MRGLLRSELLRTACCFDTVQLFPPASCIDAALAGALCCASPSPVCLRQPCWTWEGGHHRPPSPFRRRHSPLDHGRSLEHTITVLSFLRNRPFPFIVPNLVRICFLSRRSHCKIIASMNTRKLADGIAYPKYIRSQSEIQTRNILRATGRIYFTK